MDSPRIDVKALCESHRATLRRFLEARTPSWFRHRESVSDLEQTIWRQVLRVIADLDLHSDTTVKEWLLTTARNKLVDRVRFHRRECRDVRREERSRTGGRSGGASQVGHSWSPSRVLVGREELLRFERCLAKLADDERTVVRLCRLEGLSAAAAGQVLGRGEGATRALLSRALARLSTWLAEGAC